MGYLLRCVCLCRRTDFLLMLATNPRLFCTWIEIGNPNMQQTTPTTHHHERVGVALALGGRQRPKIQQSGISRNRLTLKSSHVPPASAVVAADWLRLDGSMET